MVDDEVVRSDFHDDEVVRSDFLEGDDVVLEDEVGDGVRSENLLLPKESLDHWHF